MHFLRPPLLRNEKYEKTMASLGSATVFMVLLRYMHSLANGKKAVIPTEALTQKSR
jgi:hypothetical protein